jgi:predicted NBD/HSP70 family sugar kinase
MAQVELAKATNLSTATISSLVREMSENGIVNTTSISRNNRHALYVTIANNGKIAVGVSIGKVEIRIVLGNTSHEVLSEKYFPLAENHKSDTSIVQSIVLIRDMIENIGAHISDVASVTIALPAPIDYDGNIAVPEIFQGWDTNNVRDRFEHAFGLVPVIENDANMACIAELRNPELNMPSNFLYIYADYLIGGAYVVNSSLFRGGKGISGEFGHIQADPAGPICECGRRGCLNTLAGANHLAAMLRETRGNISIRDVFDLAESGDMGCLRLVQDTAEIIAKTIEPVVSSFDTDAIIIGGKFSSIDLFVESFIQTIKKIMFPSWSDKRIVSASAGESATALGAMISSADRISE